LLAEAAAGTPWARFRVEPVALAGPEGRVPLHLLAVPTNHSLLPPNEAFTRRYAMEKFAKVGEIEVSATTLDQVVFGSDDAAPHAALPWGEFIKLDTQGSEYDILTGAERTLRENTLAVFCEVEFCELYQDQKLFSDVERFLRERGFSFFGFLNFAGRSRKQLDKRTELGRERALWADALFFKDPLPGGPAVAVTPRQHAVLIVIALLTGYFDYALELNALLGSAAERRALEKLVHDIARQPPERAVAAVRALAAGIEREPDGATVALGRLVDARRAFCDYMDIPAHQEPEESDPNVKP
jgi:FkbM family methyltransferase